MVRQHGVMSDIQLGPFNYTDVPQVFVDGVLSHFAIIVTVVSFFGFICVGVCVLFFCCVGGRSDAI